MLEAPADADRTIRLSLAGTFPDQQTAVGGVVLDGNLDLDSQTAAIQQILDILDGAQLDGFDPTVTGSPVYLKEINDYLKGGMLTLGAIALGVMAVVLALMFRVRWRMLPLLAGMVGVIWTFSILGLIGIDLSLVTISGLPILIGLGIDFAIQIHNRIEEEQVIDHDEHPIAETVSNRAPPLIAAAIAGVVAFLALPPVQSADDSRLRRAARDRHRRPRGDRYRPAGLAARHPGIEQVDRAAQPNRSSRES